MRLRLIYPSARKSRELAWWKQPRAHRFLGLGLLNVAGLCPPTIETKIIDDEYDDIDYDERIDLVGISLLTPNALRAYEIAREYREIGFDNEDESIFGRFLEFALDSHLDAAAINILTPFPGTPLHRRLEQEGRLTERNWNNYMACNLCFEPMNISNGLDDDTPLDKQGLVQLFIEHLLHLFAVLLEGIPAPGGEIQDCIGFLTHELFLNPDITRLFQPAHMGREVTEGQPRLAHEEEEVGALHHGQVGHDHQPCRFVDYPVYCPGRRLLVSSCSLTAHCRFPPPAGGSRAGRR